MLLDGEMFCEIMLHNGYELRQYVCFSYELIWKDQHILILAGCLTAAGEL